MRGCNVLIVDHGRTFANRWKHLWMSWFSWKGMEPHEILLASWRSRGRDAVNIAEGSMKLSIGVIIMTKMDEFSQRCCAILRWWLASQLGSWVLVKYNALNHVHSFKRILREWAMSWASSNRLKKQLIPKLQEWRRKFRKSRIRHEDDFLEADGADRKQMGGIAKAYRIPIDLSSW